MNDSADSNDRKQHDGADDTKERSARRSSRWRVILRVVGTAIIGFIAIATVHQMTYEPTSIEGAYEWTLRWPGTQPGAKFKTQAGDDIRRLLDILLADAGADWQAPLAEAGTIDIELSQPAYPSLWTVVKWRIWGSAELKSAERVLLTVRVREVARTPPRYEVTRIGRNGKEGTTGSFHEFPAAQDAALDDLARAMEEYQS
ncbi:MAG: hypothetical protein ACYTAS_21325 [Planctomycetota bacterium]|jgi:hypothetical protein